MTINLISDLHCAGDEFTPNFKFEKLSPADVLVIAGDIGTFKNRDTIIQKINDNYIGKDKQFKSLVYCYGNHDYYVTDYVWWKKNSKSYKKPEVFDNHIDIKDDVVFICSCMWSPIIDDHLVRRSINDYNLIPMFNTHNCTELFEKNAQWILDMVKLYKNQNKKIVVVTHHLPLEELVEERYKESPINEAFAVSDKDWEEKFLNCGVDLWLHGHSHSFMDKVINTTRFIRNPFGYDWSSMQESLTNGFRYDLVFEI